MPLAERYDPSACLLVVDVQNDFADPSGSLYVHGAERILPVVNDEIARARGAGAWIVYTQDWHPEQTPHFQRDGGWPVHCVHGTWGAALHPDLAATPDEIIRKGTGADDGYSGFTVRDAEVARRRHGRQPGDGGARGAPSDAVRSERRSTGLERSLRRRGVRRVVIVGLATDHCVKETALDAARLGFETTVLRAGVRAVDRRAGDGDRALAAMEDAGVRVA